MLFYLFDDEYSAGVQAIQLLTLKVFLKYYYSMEKQTNSRKCRKVGPYLLLKEIGKGTYSKVYEAVTTEGTTFAVKQINLQKVNQKDLQRIHLELQVLSVIKHPNIISLLDYKQTARNIYLVFEHCKNTDLEVYIAEHYHNRLPEEQVRRILIKLKSAFQCLRKHKVVHRDLKLKNILVTQDFQIKLGDFGFAKFQDQEFLTSKVGSYITMAPQIFHGEKYNQKCDIWSFGVIAYQMLFNKNPLFQKMTLTKAEILKSYEKKVTFPEQVSPLAQDLIKKMLVIDPKKRIEYQQFFNHPWLQDKVGCLSQWLRGETLKQEVARSLVQSSKSPVQKQFILQNCQTILGYSLIEFLRNYIENSITTWLNLAKHLIDMQHPNKRLNFLALAVIMENVDQSISSERHIILNAQPSLQLPPYMKFRQMQTWPMSQYTKRLPGFVNKSKTTINEYLKGVGKVNFSQLEGQTPLWTLFLQQLKKQINQDPNNLRLFLKVKSWQGPSFLINITSNVLSVHAQSILLKTVKLDFNYNDLCKKCSSIFRLAVISDPSLLELQLQKLRPLVMNWEEEE